MPTLTKRHETVIREIASPDRVRFDLRERRVYSHDTGVLPPLMRSFQLRVSADEAGSKMRVIDLARVAAEALGVKDLPDPNPEVLSQWAMFEKFSVMMTPDGMVAMMDTLTPQLLDAMPLGMGAMMRAIGRAPAPLREPLFKAMAPLLPLLFPRLLPGMMPKVLPHMIREVEAQIDMPDALRQQLPDLFPQVVDNALPKMLPQITPKYVPVLYQRLRTQLRAPRPAQGA